MDDMAYAGGNAAFKNQKLIDALKSGDREQIAKVVENSLTTARGDTEGKLSAGMIAAAKKRAEAVRDPNIDIEQQRRRREGERSHQYDALKPVTITPSRSTAPSSPSPRSSLRGR